jgi:ATP-dependent Clp protease ATP-binding subunit ClpA
MGENDPTKRKRHPLGKFDPHAKGILAAAQREAEARGGKFLISGFILLSAASRQDAIAVRLLESMKTDIGTLTEAVDAEWKSRSQYFQDRPPTLVNESIGMVVGSIQEGGQASVEALIVAMLAYEDSMAVRVVTRLGIEPTVVAAALNP